MFDANNSFSVHPGSRGNWTRVETTLYSSGEGLSIDRSTCLRAPVKTFGRFSVRGPAAWRKDGGTEKNSNTMYGACKALPHDPNPSVRQQQPAHTVRIL